MPQKKLAAKKSRKLRLAKYKSFRLSKRIKPEVLEHKQLLSAPKLFVRACKIVFKNWKLFAGLLAIFMVLDFVTIGGLNAGDFQTMRDNISDIFTGQFSQITGGVALFTFLLTSPNANGSAGSSLQAVLLVIVSLALIWALRQAYAQNKVRIRDTFYLGMYPLVPFLLVLVVIVLQLIPFLIGSFLYSVLVGSGIAALGVEQAVCGIVFALLTILSLYMILSSIFALYIVTLPDMTPMKALRSARELVRYRRLKLFRKLIFLPFALVLIAAVIMVPVIMLLTPIAVIFFFVLTTIGLAIMHSYMYGLYRELIA
jgi:hypothetical protein